MQRVSEGFGAMPPFGATLSVEEIHDIAAYVVDELPHD
jgi:mono/diheme cytochrome c family protein